MKNFALIFFILISLSLLLSCKPDPLHEETTDALLPLAYPSSTETTLIENSDIDYGYPINEVQQYEIEYYPEVVVIPEPEQKTGVVFGRLLSANSNEPYLAPALYLGKLINPEETNENLPKAFSVTSEIAPKALQALNGTFVFTDVDPGPYGLFIWSPMGYFLVNDVTNVEDDQIIVIVTAGEQLDLGDIFVE